MKVNAAIKKAGSLRYRRIKKKLKKQGPPERIEIECSAYQLLRHARLQDDSASVAKIEATLDRLCQPIGDLRPLLKSWKRRAGVFVLQVNGDWLAKPNWAVRFGFPLKSPTALALLLWLRPLNTRRGNKVSKKTSDLYRLLRFPNGSRVLTRAVKSINSTLAQLNDNLTSADVRALDKARVPLIESYQVVTNDGSRIRFEHKQYRFNEDDELVKEEPRRKIKRVMLSKEKLEHERWKMDLQGGKLSKTLTFAELREGAEI